jgi:pilus assembly protein CpaF
MTAEIMGYGPIEPFLADESVSEVMVNGPGQVYVERGGRVVETRARFTNEESLMRVIERIVTPLGRRIDEGVPMVDARLPDGSRVNAIIPPLSLIGPILTIRKFSRQRLSMDRLVELGSLTPPMCEFLRICVRYRKNILIGGGTGCGKTTFLNALSESICASERIVTIEDAAELRLAQPHVLSLEARPPNVEGRGEITIRDLVRNALRMRPDRIIVGECRGGEALDMLQAMNTGHDGSMTTGHANSPRDLLSRLEVMVLMAGMELPVRAIREQIASAVDIIVQQTRFSDGRRRVTSIVEVDGMEGEVILTQPLFVFRQQGVGPDGEVVGAFRGGGQAPRFYEALAEAGVELDRSIFAATANSPRGSA